MVTPSRARASRRGAWFGAAACIASLAGAAVCEDEPTQAKVAGYTITLPPGWNAEEEPGKGVTLVSLDSFGDDVECQLQLFSQPVTNELFLSSMQETLGAQNPVPAELPTGLGRFEGVRFLAKIPTDTTLGKIAQLAGKPHGELYLGGPPERPIGVVIMTFEGDGSEARKAMRDKCAKTVASLRP